MEKIVNTLIDEAVQKVDTYTNNGSTWLIFTDDKRWVIELTKDGTLWYNYNFFNGLFAYASMDVIENQHYITKWVENNVINKKKPVKNEVKETELHKGDRPLSINDTIQHGVKDTKENWSESKYQVEDTIQNGVKNTIRFQETRKFKVEDTIQNGVKDTQTRLTDEELEVEDTIQNGVKGTQESYTKRNPQVEDTIQNGVKETVSWLGARPNVVNTIQDGVKEIGYKKTPDESFTNHIIENGVIQTQPMSEWVNSEKIVDKTIQNGVKETKSDRGYTNHFRKKHNVDGVIQNGVKSTFNRIIGSYKPVEDTIQNGVKNTYSDKIPHEYDWTDQFDVKEVIETGVKHTEKSLQIDGSCVIEDVIKEGVKHTEYGDWEDGDERLDDIIKNGVKQTCVQIPSIDAVVERVVEEGIKETNMEEHHRLREVVQTVKNGVKETHDDVYHHTSRVEGVIKNGIKKTEHMRHLMYNPMDFSAEYSENRRLPEVTSVLEKGIKEVQPLPSQEGNMDWGNYYHRQEDRTKPHTKYVDDVITNGIKKTNAMDEWVNTEFIVDGVISKGVKKSPI